MPHNYCTFTVNTKICISWALCIHILLHSGKTQVSLCLVLCQSGNSNFGNNYSIKFTINTTTVKPLRYCTICSFYSRGLWCWIAVQLIMSNCMLISWLQSQQKKEKRIESDWPSCHSKCPWTTRRQHQNVCRNFKHWMS